MRKLLILTSLVLGACGSVPAKSSPNDPAGNFSQVENGLYRSGRPDQPGITVLQQMGVKTIMDLENDDAAVAAEKGWAEAAGITFINHPMNGMNTPDDAQVDDTLAKIADPANQPVLVHCMQGHDRTGLIIALHRVIADGWTPQAAHDEMLALGYNTMLTNMEHYFEKKTNWKD